MIRRAQNLRTRRKRTTEVEHLKLKWYTQPTMARRNFLPNWSYTIAWLRAVKLKTYDREARDSELKSSKSAGKLKNYDRKARDSELKSSKSIRSPGSELESSKPTTAKQGTDSELKSSNLHGP